MSEYTFNAKRWYQHDKDGNVKLTKSGKNAGQPVQAYYNAKLATLSEESRKLTAKRVELLKQLDDVEERQLAAIRMDARRGNVYNPDHETFLLGIFKVRDGIVQFTVKPGREGAKQAKPTRETETDISFG